MQTFEVTRSFPYQGIRRRVGDRIEVDPEHVSLLKALGHIKDDSSAKKSTYKRRDMRPEG